LRTSIGISENIGAPSIPKHEIPVAIGNEADRKTLYFPVKVTKDSIGLEEIILNDYTGTEAPSLFAYLEKNDMFLEVKGITFAKTNGVWMLKSNLEAVAKLQKDIMSDGRLILTNRGSIKTGTAFWPHLSPDADEPLIYYLGNDNRELIHAWTNMPRNIRIPYSDSGFVVSNDKEREFGIDRPAPYVRNHYAGEPFTKTEYNLYGTVEIADKPVSVVLNSLQDGEYDFKDRFISSGNSIAFLKNNSCDTYNSYSLSLGYGERYKSDMSVLRNAFFIFKFPEIDLPSNAKVSRHSLKIRMHLTAHTGTNVLDRVLVAYGYNDHARFNNILDIGFSRSSYYNRYLTQELTTPVELSNMQTGLLSVFLQRGSGFGSQNSDRTFWFSLEGLEINREIIFPLKDAKLFAGIAPQEISENTDTSNSVIPSIRGLLKAAGMDCKAEEEGDNITDIEYGLLLQGESAKFRDKLGSLAAASATIVRFDSFSNTFKVKSISRAGEITKHKISPKVLIEKGNIYSFKKQSPHRFDIFTGVEVTWGKNPITGKYENKTLVNKLGIYHNGIYSEQPIYVLEIWDLLRERLGKNIHICSGENVKTIENEWIMDKSGAEHFACNYLAWSCAPLLKAEIECITEWLKKENGERFEIGDFVYFHLPGYPDKLEKTTWIVSAIEDDLDNFTTSLQLLEAWGIEAPAEERYLLLENSGYVLLEEAEKKIELERTVWQ
jgi:hypothetical protein